MSRFFLELAYNGGAYNGWQIQPNAPSVQQTLEQALSRLSRQEISIVGAGRTDTGVHAAYYVAHFDAENLSADSHWLYHLNAMLPKDIAVYSVAEVSDDLHARFGAKEREYKYFVAKQKSPFATGLSMRPIAAPDLEAMNRAAAYLLEVEDFTSFAKLHTDNKTNICHIVDARWVENDNFYIFVIRADRFLRNMVRSVVGTLLDVGRGKVTLDGFKEIVARQDRCAAGSSAPAQGLYLTDVVYDSSLFEAKYRDRPVIEMF